MSVCLENFARKYIYIIQCFFKMANYPRKRCIIECRSFEPMYGGCQCVGGAVFNDIEMSDLVANIIKCVKSSTWYSSFRLQHWITNQFYCYVILLIQCYDVKIMRMKLVIQRKIPLSPSSPAMYLSLYFEFVLTSFILQIPGQPGCRVALSVVYMSSLL